MANDKETAKPQAKKKPEITKFKNISKMPIHFHNDGKDVSMQPGDETDLREDAYVAGLEGKLFLQRLNNKPAETSNKKA